jgi:hypothetical protein
MTERRQSDMKFAVIAFDGQGSANETEDDERVLENPNIVLGTD